MGEDDDIFSVMGEDGGRLWFTGEDEGRFWVTSEDKPQFLASFASAPHFSPKIIYQYLHLDFQLVVYHSQLREQFAQQAVDLHDAHRFGHS